jgi:hypothetical protein
VALRISAGFGACAKGVGQARLKTAHIWRDKLHAEDNNCFMEGNATPSSLPPSSQQQVAQDLALIDQTVRSLVQRIEGDELALLSLLRLLEALHREICEGPFHAALPNTRQALYALLRDIESEGGWPHIPRMKIQALLSEFFIEPPESEAE